MRLKQNAWPALMLVCMGAATWPVWRWYLARITDGSDEPWGIVALISLITLQLRDGFGFRVCERRFIWPTVLLAVYAATFGLMPPLTRAMIVTSAFGVLLLRGPGTSGAWGLLGLSLPIMATLQFYLGYPLRVLAAEASAVTLRLCGFAVDREGTLLRWAGETIMVDAPCSGIHMLWVGGYLVCLLAAFYRLNASRTLLAAGATFAIVVVTNMIRATALFFKEARIVSLPEWTHAAVGVALFAGAAWLILAMTQKLQSKPCAA